MLPLDLLAQKKQKQDFQDHLVSPIEASLAIFDQQVIPMLPIKFRVNWPRDVGGVLDPKIANIRSDRKSKMAAKRPPLKIIFSLLLLNQNAK